jgi:hypothetical protein
VGHFADMDVATGADVKEERLKALRPLAEAAGVGEEAQPSSIVWRCFSSGASHIVLVRWSVRSGGELVILTQAGGGKAAPRLTICRAT